MVRREPLILPFLALACGVLWAHFYYLRFSELWIPAGLAIIAAILCLSVRRRSQIRVLGAAALLLVAGTATQVLHRSSRHPKLNIADGDSALLSGCVVDPAVLSPNREQFTLELAPRVRIRMAAVLKGTERLHLPYGTLIEVAAKVRSPRNFQNPDAFDYQAYLAHQSIFWTGSVASVSDIRRLPGRCGSKAAALLYGVRSWALQRLTALYPDDPHTAALLQATLLGETSGVERRWTDDFRVTGTYHALVISGQHISVLALSILFLLRLLQVRRVPALAVATAACWLYAFISGMSSPVVRAAGGFTLFLAASFVFRKTRILNILAAVGIAYLLVSPDQLFDPSFQLSFLSAAAIAAFAIPLMERYTEPLRASVKRFDQVAYDPRVAACAAEWRVELRLLARTVSVWTRLPLLRAQWLVARGVGVGVFVAEAVAVSACVQFGLALPMISYFHRLSLTGLSANIIVVPLLSVVVPLGFASILTGSHVLAYGTALFLQWAEAVAAWHMRFEPGWRMGAIPLPLAIAFAVSLLALGLAIRFGGRRSIVPFLAGSLALFAAICFQPWPPLVQPGMLEVTALDVSQGDSLLIVFPDGETMLVDAGGFPGMERMKRKPQLDMGEDVVSPYLWSRRIRRIDYAVVSHGHSDHMAGMPAVLDNFLPRILWTGVEPKTAEWKTVEQHAAADHVRIVSLRRGTPDFEIGGAQVRVLAPSPDYVPATTARNDDSLVLEIRYRKRSVLLTGDAEHPVESDLVNSGLLRPVTLLKVGHHGSKTSSSEEFLQQVSPRLAFISDGYLNQFHHPNGVVLDRLAEHHAAVFRTDQRGLLTFRTDGDRVEVRTFE